MPPRFFQRMQKNSAKRVAVAGSDHRGKGAVQSRYNDILVAFSPQLHVPVEDNDDTIDTGPIPMDLTIEIAHNAQIVRNKSGKPIQTLPWGTKISSTDTTPISVV